MPSTAVLVDAGAFIALFHRGDDDHARIAAYLRQHFGHLITTWPALAEASHLVGHKRVALLDYVAAPRWRILGMEGAAPRLRDLMRKYSDRPMDLADASIIWAAEETGVLDVLTTDLTDFAIYRTGTGRALRILPDGD